jgi:hypothetical protein
MLATWVALLVLLLAGLAMADEGMWLYDHAPVKLIQQKYNFNLKQAWLDHTRMSSVRFNSGGSGSFVSPNGLTFTNHHIAQSCLHGISTQEKDLYKLGFYAKTQADEAKCPDLELNVLMSMQDVTKQINAAVKPGMTPAQAGAAQRAAMSQAESDCSKETGLRCDIVQLYSGAVYYIYRYKKYTDVRLVFAPEFDIAFFGGDPDNFEFPRYDLDIAFFRAYEDGKPARLDNYFKFSTQGLKEGDLAFVSGHPGSTGRLLTISQLAFRRDVSSKFDLDDMVRRDNVLRAWAAKSEENYRRAQDAIFGIENNIKRGKIYYQTLLDPQVMAKKQAEETELRQTVSSDPKKQAEFGDPWTSVAQAMRLHREIFLPLSMFERRAALRGSLAGYARALVRVADEKKKPNGERLREYSDTALPALENALFAAEPVYKDLEEVMLSDSLTFLANQMPDAAATKAILGGRTPAVAAHELVAGTKLDDPAVRKQLYVGGAAAIAASTDPMIVALRTIEPESRAVRQRYEDEVAAVERLDGGKIGRIRFARSGFSVAPDANFTLRLSYGPVRGYVEDGLGDAVPKGSRIAPFTQIAGLYERSAKYGNKDPFKLPQSWVDAKSKLKLDTPFNLVSTDDIIGGNSGSPVVDTKGEVVGIIFDGNMQSLPWNYIYSDEAGRAVSVDSRGILEALRNVYGTQRLLDELLGKPAKAKAAKQAKPEAR